jgi:hypothetical protein
MTSAATNPYLNVPMPEWAVWAEEWQPNDGDRGYRNFRGEERHRPCLPWSRHIG